MWRSYAVLIARDTEEEQTVLGKETPEGQTVPLSRMYREGVQNLEDLNNPSMISSLDLSLPVDVQNPVALPKMEQTTCKTILGQPLMTCYHCYTNYSANSFSNYFFAFASVLI